MKSKSFLEIDSVIVIENVKDAFFNGAWKVLKISDDATPKLHLESMHRANKAFLNKDFDASTMRPLDEKNDVVYKDAFLPIGSTIETTSDKGDVETWTVANILSGDRLDNVRLRLEKDVSKHFNVHAVHMTTKFKPAEMKITNIAKPQLSRLQLK